MADPRRPSERGAALLTVLLLVAVMAVVAASALERVTLATRLTGNAGVQAQARAYAEAAETIARLRIADLVAAQPGKTTLAGGWLGTPQQLPVPGGTATARVTDSGNCFNLNSVVAGTGSSNLAMRPIAISQFQALMQALAIDPRQAQFIATSLADWIDSDSIPLPGGGEDEAYLRLPQPYRTANRMMTDASELRAVQGVTPAIYGLLRPWVCALPVSDLSPINVNTLLPQQAPLFAMLFPGQASVEQARQWLAQRPADGYGSLNDFWAAPQRAGFTPPGEVGTQTKLTSRWFRVDINVEVGGIGMSETALIDAQAAPAKLIYRHWGENI
ncbi:MAG: type II secretion system minor pseudopilin GspK [Sphingobium sp.]|uniref:type II secretion system minor pseudopilin GspK n=1 Tax=Sphingobium sp. TaxID=1912891 RepID=UPI0029AF2CE3|nr:type II secretion system minor pseudopilin GspK [Sphingobium sp.]MDX3908863.1 type II secretion system minor pseudopilin GspK [Sphingobium sp.]